VSGGRPGAGSADLSIYPAIGRDATAFNWRRKRRIYARSRLYVTAISGWLMDRVRQSMLKGIPQRMVPNGIDLGVFKPSDRPEARRQLGLPTGASIVLLIAHNPFKDYEIMEGAVERLQAHPAADLLFVCLGRRGPDRKGGSGRIIYPGFERDPKRMALYYSAADLFIHAARTRHLARPSRKPWRVAPRWWRPPSAASPS